ncbi:MAG: threonine dehydratase [Burkholderiales bacterium]|nr:threonine dehydratase [Burkholderiales bacterium]
MNELPRLERLEAAARIVYDLMPATPQYRWPLLCQALQAEVWVKHENHTPTGAFKLRGGLVYFGDLARGAQPPAGVVSATRGNHGQSIALAAARHGMRAVVVVPHGNSVEKNAAMRAWGATLVEHGEDFQAAREHAAALAQAQGLTVVPSFHPLLVQGVATYALELLRALAALDVVYVPIGMGSGICGLIAAREALGLRTQIVGVVSAHAPAYALSFRQRALVTHPTTTRLGDGMACSTPDPQALEWIWRHAERVVEVGDDELAAAMRLLFRATHNVAEGAGAAALAAALQERGRLQGRRVAVVLSGGNVDSDVFAGVLAAP